MAEEPELTDWLASGTGSGSQHANPAGSQQASPAQPGWNPQAGWQPQAGPHAGWQPQRPPASAARRRWTGVGLVAAGVVAGGVLAGTIGASAASSSSATTPASTGSYSAETPAMPGAAGGGNGPQGGHEDHGSAPVRSDEKSLSSSLTTTLTEKAKAAVAGGTVYRVESDSGDAAYEAHMTKSDGTEVTVKFDKNGNVTGVEQGMGK